MQKCLWYQNDDFGWTKLYLESIMKLLWVTRVLKIMVWVGSAKKASGWIKSQVGF